MQTTLQSAFPADTRDQGHGYFKSRRVYGLEFQDRRVQGNVLGSRAYNVNIDWSNAEGANEIEFWCDCQAFVDFGPCKHLWALVLEAESKATPEFQESLPEGSSAPSKHEKEVWRHRVGSLHNQVVEDRRDPWHGLADPSFQIIYVLVDPDDAKPGALILETQICRRLKSGKWGVPRPYAVGNREDRAPTEASDLHILSRLAGAEINDWGRYYPTPVIASQFALDRTFCEELLRPICDTGRLYVGRDRPADGPGRPLEWDDGEPWVPRLDFVDDEELGVSRLFCTLARGDKSLDLSEANLLLPTGYLVADGALARVDDRDSMPLLEELRANGPMTMDPEHRDECLEALAKLRQPLMADLAGPTDLITPAPKPNLFIAGDGSPAHGSRSLDCFIHFDYDGTEVRPEDPRDVIPGAEAERSIQRDFDAESSALAEFLAAGGIRETGDAWQDRQATIKASQLPAMVRHLLDHDWSVNAEGKIWVQPGKHAISVRSGVDWFEVEGGLRYGDQIASLPALLAAAKSGSNTVELGDGTYGLLPERWMADWGLLEIAGEIDGDSIRFPRLQGFMLDALLAEKEGVAGDAAFVKMQERLKNFDGIEARTEPESFQGSLRTYQRDGLGWFDFLREMGFGGCLADDMGLGKTVQVLALLEERRCEVGPDGNPLPQRTSLVVVPRSLIFNWVDEAARFAPQLKVLDYTGPERRQRAEGWDEADLVVTTYGTMRKDILELRQKEFDYVVLDEATAIKNAGSQAAKAARLLNGQHRLALSGTPIENHLGELWSLFEFLNPGMLGRTRSFQAFVTGAARKGDDPEGGKDDPGISPLASALRPFFLRRTKQDVLHDLPAKTEQTIHCEFSETERREYDELRNHYRANLLDRGEASPNLGGKKFQVLEALLRLRQAACHPGLIHPERVGSDSAKLTTLLPMLEEIIDEGHKALVFSQFTSLLAIVRKRLDAAKIPYAYLDGKTRKRKEKVERFQTDPACPLFLISLKAGGHGLNLTAADYIFLLDPWWNPAVESQAIDRAHRIGRTRPVSAYRIIVRDTVEEKVIELQRSKRQLAEAILQEGGGVLKDLTRDDLDSLLS